MSNDNDFIRRKVILDALQEGMSSYAIPWALVDTVKDIPAANHAETAHLDSAKERQLRDDLDASENEILELKAKLETAAPFCSPGFIERNWRKANVLHDASAALGNERSRFAHITDPKGIELIEAGLKLLKEKV